MGGKKGSSNNHFRGTQINFCASSRNFLYPFLLWKISTLKEMEETKVWSPRPYILLNCHAFIWNIVAAYLVTPEAGGTTGSSLKNDWDHLQKDGFFLENTKHGFLFLAFKPQAIKGNNHLKSTLLCCCSASIGNTSCNRYLVWISNDSAGGVDYQWKLARTLK